MIPNNMDVKKKSRLSLFSRRLHEAITLASLPSLDQDAVAADVHEGGTRNADDGPLMRTVIKYTRIVKLLLLQQKSQRERKYEETARKQKDEQQGRSTSSEDDEPSEDSAILLPHPHATSDCGDGDVADDGEARCVLERAVRLLNRWAGTSLRTEDLCCGVEGVSGGDDRDAAVCPVSVVWCDKTKKYEMNTRGLASAVLDLSNHDGRQEPSSAKATPTVSKGKHQRDEPKVIASPSTAGDAADGDKKLGDNILNEVSRAILEMKEGALRMKQVMQSEEQTLRENDELLQKTLESTKKQSGEVEAISGGRRGGLLSAPLSGSGGGGKLLEMSSMARMMFSGIYDVIMRALWMALVLAVTLGTLFIVVMVPRAYETVLVKGAA